MRMPCVSRLFKRERRVGRSQRGQSLVELALTLPILTAILMGIVDVSFVLYAHVQVASAAREGARAGSLHQGDFGEAIGTNDSTRAAAVRAAVHNPGGGTTSLGLLPTSAANFVVTSSDVTITYDPASPLDATNTIRRGDDIIVTVTYRQSLWFDFLPTPLTDYMQVRSTAQMRVQ